MYTIRYTIRNILKNKTNTIINISGLFLSMTTILLLILFIKHELGYDKQFTDYENIYRISSKFMTPDNVQHIAIAPLPLRHILKDEFPEIEETSVIIELPESGIIEYEGKQFMQDGFRNASQNIFKILDYKFLMGNPETALSEPNSVVLTESVARKIMGNQLEINKEILIDKTPAIITAIITDLPKNMDLHFSVLFPGYENKSDDMLDFDGHMYVKMKPNASKSIYEILNQIEKEYYVPLQEQLEGLEIKFEPQRIDKLHFSDQLLADNPKGNIQYVYFFSIIAFIILLVACINYINLSFARITERNYFEGLCRINGANNLQSIRFLFLESTVLAGISLIISMVLVFLCLPLFNIISYKDISADSIFSISFISLSFLLFLIILVIINGLPVLSRLIFKKHHDIQSLIRKRTNKSGNYRGSLVVTQFAFTIILIICLIAFQRQIYYMKNKDLGFDLKNVLIIDPPFHNENPESIRHFIIKLRQLPGITDVSNPAGGAMPGNIMTSEKMIHATKINGEMKQFIVSLCYVDSNYLDLLKIKLVKGKGFSNIPEANKNKCIINESYAKILGIFDNPEGEKIHEGKVEVTGVVKDFHFLSPNNPIEPICFNFFNEPSDIVFIRYDHDILPQIKTLWENTVPDNPFIYSILEDSYSKQYIKDENIYKIITFFTVLSVLISCLGVIGLIKYTCEKRLKEIGVRKVFGARAKEIMSLINKEFFRWVLLSFIISCPVAWFIVNNWYKNYAYHTKISSGLFILAGFIISFITISIVSWFTWFWANRNPVDAIRYE